MIDVHDRVVACETVGLNLVAHVKLAEDRAGEGACDDMRGEIDGVRNLGDLLRWDGKWGRKSLDEIGKRPRLIGRVIVLLHHMLPI